MHNAGGKNPPVKFAEMRRGGEGGITLKFAYSIIINGANFSYALSYTEIQSMMNMGPSKKVLSATQELPPYFADQWWTTSYTKTEA